MRLNAYITGQRYPKFHWTVNDSFTDEEIAKTAAKSANDFFMGDLEDCYYTRFLITGGEIIGIEIVDLTEQAKKFLDVPE